MAIIKRGDSWRVMESYEGPDGKRHQVTKTAHSSAEAKLVSAQLRIDIGRGTFIKPSKITLKFHLNQWLDNYVVPNLSTSTAETYRFIAEKHILPLLGHLPLSKLQSQAVQNLYSEKIKAGLSSATVRKIHNILHKSLDNALKTGLIVRNPLIAVECPKLHSREMTTLNETDIHLLLDRARDTDYYPLWYTLIFTGMRRGEALALKWGDVDLLLLKISINKSVTYLNALNAIHNGSRLQYKAPKTAKSRRYISITPSNAVILREYRDKQNQIRQSLEAPHLKEDDFVFATIDGKAYLPNSITHAWIKLTRRCGLPGRRLHDCRHTYASLLLRQNVHPSVVANQLGHASVKTTLDLYSHVSPGMQEAAAERFDDIVIGKSVTNPLPFEKNGTN